jgi:hypothetical protein
MDYHETRMCLERGHQRKLTHSIQTASSACQAFNLTYLNLKLPHEKKFYHVFDGVISKIRVRIEHFQQTIVQEHGSRGSCPTSSHISPRPWELVGNLCEIVKPTPARFLRSAQLCCNSVTKICLFSEVAGYAPFISPTSG